MKILTIDDDPTIQELFLTGLCSEGFDITQAYNAKDGLELIESQVFDCIILDNMLPDIAGVSLCAMIRDKGIDTPIIALSVQTATDQKVAFFNAGADDYMEKPFTFSELIARIHAVTRRGTTKTPDIISYRTITYDLHNDKLTVGGETVYLTHREAKLLEYLLLNRGTLLTRAMIYEHVWNMRADPFSNSIEAHILALRRKLGSPRNAKDSIIKTVPGRGYMID
ncbi:hypothetical protein A3C87_00280 [Candidatus Kaiserbacteria bacterium RIFCSPHIGHO2_02_FULL_49_34]|uniref:DNA-binding response regulator n=1 Tax=Candidatus Kaiserbacteria bacterium RIFCSPHIGHO2_02_FULL_49_34 TaxID=1798491 RepID=A0A1F6DKJ1_9BACT|nr:MAG: hypothetical protein A3C87_00280 [Candidatus Kaiserbacteria bacterium RIFCSPHIGHO2_02_FULL_49_34]